MTESEFIDWAKKCIAESLPAAKARETEERRSGKKLTNGPVARLLAPPCSKDARTLKRYRSSGELEILAEERISLVERMETIDRVLLCGKTRFLNARREWDIFKSIREEVLVRGQDQDLLYRLFQHTYAAVAIIRVERPDGKYVLAGIRAKNLGSFYGSAVSFPGGLVNPGETLIQAAKRELKEEAGYLAKDASQSPYACYTSDKAASTSFGLFLDAPDTQPLRKNVSSEMSGRSCIWVPERALDALSAYGYSKDIDDCFNKAGIPAERLTMALDTASIYKQLRKAGY